MQKFNEFSSGPSQAFLRTHPLTIDRISDIQNRLKISNIPKKKIAWVLSYKIKIKSIDFEYCWCFPGIWEWIKMKNYIKEYASYFGLAYAYLRQNKVLEARKNFDILSTFYVSSPIINELEATLLVKEKNSIKLLRYIKRNK